MTMTNNGLLKLNIQHFAQTKAADLIDPEVLADAISAQLESKIRFAPYARIDSTLEGQPGSTITRPKYAYIGAADDLVEGVAMDTSKLSMTTTQVSVKEVGKAVEVTETAIITNVDGTMTEAGNQIVLSLADKIEIDYIATLATTLLTQASAPTVAANIIAAVDVFDDEDEEDYILFINNKDYTVLVKEFFGEGATAKLLSIAEVAGALGLKAIERTKRLAEGTAYLQKQDAVEIVYKKRANVEAGHDILARTHILAGNQHYATNLYNDSGVVKISAT